MSHGTIIAFSTIKLPKEKWSECLYTDEKPNICADYWGDPKDEYRDEIINNWHYDGLDINKEDESFTVSHTQKDFVDSIKHRVEKFLEVTKYPYCCIKQYVMYGDYDYISFYDELEGVYYSYPQLLEYYSGYTLYICGMFDFHM